MLLRPQLRTRHTHSHHRDSVRSRWELASVSAGWPRTESWWTPGIDALADALSGSGGNRLAAAERLGGERAIAGFSLTDSLLDLGCGMDVLKVSHRARSELAGSLSVGWVDGLTPWIMRGRLCLDVLTDLTSRDYLATRLRELYTEASHSGEPLDRSRVLVVVLVRSSTEPLITEQRMVAVGRVLSSVFTGGESLSRISPNLAVALARRSESLNDQLVSLHLELGWSGLSVQPAGARVWLEPLPGVVDAIDPLFDEMTGF